MLFHNFVIVRGIIFSFMYATHTIRRRCNAIGIFEGRVRFNDPFYVDLSVLSAIDKQFIMCLVMSALVQSSWDISLKNCYLF